MLTSKPQSDLKQSLQHLLLSDCPTAQLYQHYIVHSCVILMSRYFITMSQSASKIISAYNAAF